MGKTAHFTNTYTSPIGRITLGSDGKRLAGLWFEGQRYFGSTLAPGAKVRQLTIFELTKEWLEIYFNGGQPSFMPPLLLDDTPFRLSVWQTLLAIPYGETVSYMDLARARGLTALSARAIGGAVGHNPVSIIIPCHRVIGSNGRLAGYAGGIDRKLALLRIEQEGSLHHLGPEG